MTGLCFFDAARFRENCFWEPAKIAFWNRDDGDGSVFGVAGFIVTPLVGAFPTPIIRGWLVLSFVVSTLVVQATRLGITSTSRLFISGAGCN